MLEKGDMCITVCRSQSTLKYLSSPGKGLGNLSIRIMGKQSVNHHTHVEFCGCVYCVDFIVAFF